MSFLQFSTEWPAWYVLLCLVLGLAGAYLLYYFKDKVFKSLSPKWRVVLFVFRTLSIGLLSILLLSPLLKYNKREVEKPIIAIGLDASQSIIFNADSTKIKAQILAQLSAFNKKDNKFQVAFYSFGEKVKAELDSNFTEQASDISAFFAAIANEYTNRNLAAVILASDGIYNQGPNPLYAYQNSAVPLYTIGLGDTVERKDLIIQSIKAPEKVYLGNVIPIELKIQAQQCAGENFELNISENNKLLSNKNFNISGNKNQISALLNLEALQKGIHHYVLTVSNLSNEISYANNKKDLYIEVLEGKNKVLILACAPHPDISAIKSALEESLNYDIELNFGEKTLQARDYDAIILHQIPSNYNAAADLLKQIKENQIPVWYILGNQSNITSFNNLNSGLSINGMQAKANEAQAALNPNFSFFTSSPELPALLAKLPPLQSPFGSYKIASGNGVLLYQQIGGLQSDYPLWYFNNSTSKNAILAGEGLWRWYFKEFQLNQNHTYTSELINKTMQWLCSKNSNKKFRILAQKSYNENNQIQVNAELYNENNELVNQPEIAFNILNDQKKTFQFQFSKSDKSYTLNAGKLPAGLYNYKANVSLGNKVYTEEGSFTVKALQLEEQDLVANHQLLRTMAKAGNGKFFTLEQVPQLIKLLEEKNDIKAVIYNHVDVDDAINVKWIFFILLTLLSVEWFLRKYFGSY